MLNLNERRSSINSRRSRRITRKINEELNEELQVDDDEEEYSLRIFNVFNKIKTNYYCVVLFL